jgi:hypothetical protein
MRYFTYMAEQSFKTSETGERLFYLGGFWSRPFVIPDADTERRLFKKLIWMLRVLLGGLVVGQPLLFFMRPEVLYQPYWFFVYFVVVMLVWWIVGRILFAPDLRGLARAPFRLRPRSLYGQMAQRHSKTWLILGLVGSLLFVVAGVWMLSVGANLAVAILAVSFFGLCAVAWGYALYVKSLIEDLPAMSDEKRRT